MADETEKKDAVEVQQTDVDPWAAAFAALDNEDEKGAEAASGAGDGEDAGDVGHAEGADTGVGAADAEAGDGAGDADLPGGPGDTAGEDNGSDGLDSWGDIDVSEDQVREYRESFMEDIRQRTLTDVANAYIRQGARNDNGRLGATINDPDICKRDSDGVPRFYNPETKREFTGDNPRKQAQEWVDAYNKELADAFNKTCREYSQRLMQQEGGRLAIIEFAPKYKKLDPVRRSMLDSILEDYEVTDDDGDVVAYSCDLDKALAAVNRQVKVIQERYSSHNVNLQEKKAEPTGPALDTPSTNGGQQGGGRPQFKSIEEAMEWEQDQILARMKGGSR